MRAGLFALSTVSVGVSTGRTRSCFRLTCSIPPTWADTILLLAECRVELRGSAAFIDILQCGAAAGINRAVCDLPLAWHVDKMRMEWWLQARLPVNRKLAMEAFMEGYHVTETHPQRLPPGVKGRVYYEPSPGGTGSRSARRVIPPSILGFDRYADPLF